MRDLGSGRVSVGPVCASTHVAGLQQGLIPGEPSGSEGSQQPSAAGVDAVVRVEAPQPPHPPEHSSLESTEQHVIVGIELFIAERQPTYDQPKRGWSEMAIMRARVRRSMGAVTRFYA